MHLRILGLLLFWVVFEFADPLGMDTAARAAVDTFISAISTPFHGLADDPASGEIAVVELTLDGDAWPVPIARHAEALATILAVHPKAVFVDVRFLERVPGQRLVGFDSVLRSADEQGIPILFARGRPEWAELPEPLTSRGTLNAWDGGQRSYPLLVRPEAGAHGDPQNGKELPTAAYDLYRRLCGSGALPGRCTGPPDDARFADVLHVRWGSTPDPLQNQISQGCRATGSAFSRLGDAALYGMVSLFRITQNWAVQPCRSLLTMRVKDLDLGLAGNAEVPARELLAGRVVFYGVAIDGDHDTTTAPVLGTLPGVQQHAAAFENLLTYGTGYYHEPGTVLEMPLPNGHAIEVNTVEMAQFAAWVVFLVVLTAGWLDERDNAMQSRRSWWTKVPSRRMVIGVVCASAGVMAFAIDVARSGRPAPGLFAALYGLLALATFAVFAPAERRGYVRHVLTITVLAGWGMVGNELWWHLPAAEWLGFVVLYLAVSETVEPAEESAAGLLSGRSRHHPHPSKKGSVS